MFKALSSDDVRAVLASEEEAQESADRLVASAVGRGAEDNVTVLVIDVQ
jgi:serine/threonine protein phosphatase PrpC